MIEPTDKPLLQNADAPVWQTGDGLVIGDLRTGALYRLNSMAAAVWCLCDGNNTLRSIVRTLSEVYPNHATEIAESTEMTISQLQNSGLIRELDQDEHLDRTADVPEVKSREVIRALLGLRFWRVYANYHSCLYVSIISILLATGETGWVVYERVFVLQLSLFLYGSYVLSLNDFCHRHADLRIGDRRFAHELPRWFESTLVVVLLVACLGWSWFVVDDMVYFVVLCTALASTTAYSAPPLRLKTRGLAGHVVSFWDCFSPYVLIFCFYRYWRLDTVLLGSAYVTMTLIAGIGHLLFHRHYDRVLGTESLAVRKGSTWTSRILKRLQLAGAALWWACLLYYSITIPRLLPAAILYFALRFVRFQPASGFQDYFLSVKARDLAIILAACAAVTHWTYALLLPLVLVFERQFVTRRFKTLFKRPAETHPAT